MCFSIADEIFSILADSLARVSLTSFACLKLYSDNSSSLLLVSKSPLSMVVYLWKICSLIISFFLETSVIFSRVKLWTSARPSPICSLTPLTISESAYRPSCKEDIILRSLSSWPLSSKLRRSIKRANFYSNHFLISSSFLTRKAPSSSTFLSILWMVVLIKSNSLSILSALIYSIVIFCSVEP